MRFLANGFFSDEMYRILVHSHSFHCVTCQTLSLTLSLSLTEFNNSALSNSNCYNQIYYFVCVALVLDHSFI